jgi:hypothetical protein
MNTNAGNVDTVLSIWFCIHRLPRNARIAGRKIWNNWIHCVR